MTTRLRCAASATPHGGPSYDLRLCARLHRPPEPRRADRAVDCRGCAKVFQEKASGARGDRAALKRAITQLGEGDVLLVTRLDRLARSIRDLLNVLDEVTKRRAGFRSLADAWADTTTPHGRLMVAVLGGLAEFEGDLIRSRTSEGLKRARARGVEARQQAQADASPAAPSPCAPTSGRELRRDRAQLQRLAQHDFTAQSRSESQLGRNMIEEKGISEDAISAMSALGFHYIKIRKENSDLLDTIKDISIDEKQRFFGISAKPTFCTVSRPKHKPSSSINQTRARQATPATLSASPRRKVWSPFSRAAYPAPGARRQDRGQSRSGRRGWAGQA